MKTSKLAIAVLLLASNLAFAGQSSQKDKASKAKIYVDKYKSNVLLTDSQIVKLTKCSKEYFDQVDNAQLIANESVRTNALIDIQRAFQNVKDSILTPDQRIIQKNKIEDRKTKLANKYK